VFEDAVAAIGRDLQGWLERFGGTIEWRPAAIEHSLSGDDRKGVELEDGLRVYGRVDLVEERADDSLRATDFKTGKIEAPPGARVHGGAMLQPLLYALALERTRPDRTVVAGRLVGVTARSEHVERAVPLDASGRGDVMSVLRTIDHALRDGFLPAAPAKDACERCELLALCGPYESERTARKDAARLEPLVALRRMP
jgi:RecB family exonuclease